MRAAWMQCMCGMTHGCVARLAVAGVLLMKKQGR